MPTDQATSCESSVYKYRILEKPHDIRILKLLPGNRGSTVRCSFRVIDIEDADVPEYTAISYTWGKAELNETIEYETGELLQITTNLHDALLALRYRVGPRYVWADAVCINQADKSEKTKQVRLMKLVYQRATRTVGYLGREEGYEEAAIAMFERVSKVWSYEQDPSEEREVRITRKGLIPSLDAYGLPDEWSYEWQTVRELLLRPWFRRVWIIQEYAMSRRFYFTYGKGEAIIEFSLIHNLEHQLRQLNILMVLDGNLLKAAVMPVITGICHMDVIQKGFQAKKLKPLDSLISRGSLHTATDPRDHVFALVGLSAESSVADIQPDYEIGVMGVFQNVFEFLVLRNNSLDLLSEAGTYEKSLDLPSWVPDWTIARHYTSMARYKSSLKPNFRATRDSPVIACIEHGSRALTVRGCILDTILDQGRNIWTVDVRFENVDDKTHASCFLEGLGLASCCPSDQQSHYTRHMHALVSDDFSARESMDILTEDHYYALLYEFYKVLHLSAPPSPVHDNQSFDLFKRAMIIDGRQKRLCLTSTHRLLGKVPMQALVGDHICVISGAKVPFVLREQKNEISGRATFQLVGECFIQEWMYGKALDLPDVTFKDLILI